MIENPKIGQEVWFAEACNQRIHSAKLIAFNEVEVSTRKYIYMQKLKWRMAAGWDGR